MLITIFIHTNNKQGIGGVLSKFSIEQQTAHRDDVAVKEINVDELQAFRDFAGATYLRNGREVTYDPADLQSFTLSRFMPPELMGYQGRAIVIDPDIFAVGPIDELLDIDLAGHAIGACRKKDAWDTSMMLMDCSQLTHWNIEDILARLKNHTLAYQDLMTLKTEDPETILEVPRRWNSLDSLQPDTGFLHTTSRLTQPWRTGLPIDFTRNPLPKLFGFIPREPIYKLLGKWDTRYQPHPDPDVRAWFESFIQDAYQNGVITSNYIEKEVVAGHVRRDLLELATGAASPSQS